MTTTSRSTDTPPALPPAALLYDDFAGEHASTRRILERYPDGQGSWRPHEKSRTLAQLATHVADIVNRGTSVLETDGMDVTSRQPLAPMDSARELVAHFDAAVERFTAALARADYASLQQTWAMKRGSQVMIERPKRVLLRVLLMSHLVHHRGQLGVYYRLLGVPVPGVYGPSADD
jgi:uncharacterized damage-inducible protein DinB